MFIHFPVRYVKNYWGYQPNPVMVIWLVVWIMNFMFPYIGNFIIPTDDSSYFFQRGRYTTNQKRFLVDSTAMLRTRTGIHAEMPRFPGREATEHVTTVEVPPWVPPRRSQWSPSANPCAVPRSSSNRNRRRRGTSATSRTSWRGGSGVFTWIYRETIRNPQRSGKIGQDSRWSIGKLWETTMSGASIGTNVYFFGGTP